MKQIKPAVTILLCIIMIVSTLNCSYGKNKKISEGNKYTPTAVDYYMVEVAYAINKNWKLTEDIDLDNDPICSIVFKIMPNGEIKDIAFTEKSGNATLDTSALLAVKRTNPTEPFPKSIKKPFIEMGLRSAPNGVR